jgi:hypothetical protein
VTPPAEAASRERSPMRGQRRGSAGERADSDQNAANRSCTLCNYPSPFSNRNTSVRKKTPHSEVHTRSPSSEHFEACYQLEQRQHNDPSAWNAPKPPRRSFSPHVSMLVTDPNNVSTTNRRHGMPFPSPPLTI